MRTLVLGGTGMLGRAVVAQGRHRGHAVLGLSRAQADITDAERLVYWVDTFGADVVINCAAFTRVDDCETEQAHATAINGDAVQNIVEAAARRNARVLHVSSDYVFDGTATEPYREDAPTGPASVYGASKLRGETHVATYPHGLAVRTSWLFGPGGPNFVLTMRRLMLEGKLPLRVVDDQVGAPTYTPYLARALWDLAAAGATGVLHYQNREPVSWHGFAVAIAAAVRPGTEVVPVSTSTFPRPAPRPAFSVLDTSRFAATVGRPVEPWLAGLTDYLGGLQ